jgi:hypothetical protein
MILDSREISMSEIGYKSGGHIRTGDMSITMVTELRDGTTQATTVRVDTTKLNSVDVDSRDTYQDELYDRVADEFARLIKLWEDSKHREDT